MSKVICIYSLNGQCKMSATHVKLCGHAKPHRRRCGDKLKSPCKSPEGSYRDCPADCSDVNSIEVTRASL